MESTRPALVTAQAPCHASRCRPSRVSRRRRQNKRLTLHALATGEVLASISLGMLRACRERLCESGDLALRAQHIIFLGRALQIARVLAAV